MTKIEFELICLGQMEADMQNSTYRPLLPPREAARILGIHVDTLNKIVAEGRLAPPIRISTRRLGFRPDDLDVFLSPSAKASV